MNSLPSVRQSLLFGYLSQYWLIIFFWIIFNWWFMGIFEWFRIAVESIFSYFGWLWVELCSHLWIFGLLPLFLAEIWEIEYIAPTNERVRHRIRVSFSSQFSSIPRYQKTGQCCGTHSRLIIVIMQHQPVFDGQAISCLGLRVAAVCVCAFVTKSCKCFFHRNIKIFLFIRTRSMHRRLGGRIDSPHKFGAHAQKT